MAQERWEVASGAGPQEPTAGGAQWDGSAVES